MCMYINIGRTDLLVLPVRLAGQVSNPPHATLAMFFSRMQTSFFIATLSPDAATREGGLANGHVTASACDRGALIPRNCGDAKLNSLLGLLACPESIG